MQALHIIDIRNCLEIVKHHKLRFAIVEIVAAAIGLIIGFSIPRTYLSTVKLAPETQNANMGGGLSSLSSMLGMNLGNLTGEDAINPELYPDVKSSPDFLLGLCNVKVTTADGQLTTDYKTYLTRHCKATWWDALRLKLFPPKGGTVTSSSAVDTMKVIRLSMPDFLLMEAIDNSIACDMDKKTGVITISAMAQDPLVATILVDSVSARLRDFITDYRTKKARNDQAYFAKCYAEADAAYRKAAQNYAAYSDAHQDLSLESYRVENDNLENEMQQAFNIKSEYATKLELAKAKVLERTPVYTVLQAPFVPVKHIAPRRSIILLMWLVLGAAVGFFLCYRKERLPIFYAKAVGTKTTDSPDTAERPETQENA